MTKQDFLASLGKGLSSLPKDDIEERLSFYSEMIDDRIEEGLTEEEAVIAVGSTQDIVAQVVADTPLAKIAKEKLKPKRRLKVWEIVLLVLGSPIWLSLGISAIAVIFSLYIVLWSVIVSLWAVFASLVGCSIGGALACVILTVGGNGASGLAMLAAGFVCAGLAIFMFYGCKAATKGTLILTKKIAIWTKNCFRGKGDAQ